MTLPYTVLVDDNFHYQDKEHRYRLGEFATVDEAIAACKRIVDEYLRGAIEPGMTADRLYVTYTSFGDDPFIVDPEHGVIFSAWGYAKQRCNELLAAGDEPMVNGVPHRLLDGYHGGKEVSAEALQDLLASAPAEIQARAKEWAEERVKLEAEAAAKAGQQEL